MCPKRSSWFLLQFSPATAIPGEENTLTVSAQAGSLCGICAVDQSVRIMEPGRRLSPKMLFDLLPMRSVYPYSVEDEQECIHFQPRRPAPISDAYTTFKRVGMKIATNIAVLALQCHDYNHHFPGAFERNDAVAFGAAAAALEAENAGVKHSPSCFTWKPQSNSQQPFDRPLQATFKVVWMYLENVED
ncbi:murinoglobulin-1-like [Sinocyclocheilus grahami]|uniref:murinoglobulin-1-like n=1 Tax=Sinocyclocheilus grahami TaxID=75366 RepID=UPI0007AD6812|nr:PREDICTED: murinoglobulin-1-like [Sinocyclocheilus grahami]